MPTEHTRWFLLPATDVTSPTSDPGISRHIRPKYTDDADLAGSMSTQVPSQPVADVFPTLVESYPDVSPWYATHCRALGDAGLSALDSISAQDDTRDMSDVPDDAGRILQARYPEITRSLTEWAQAIRA